MELGPKLTSYCRILGRVFKIMQQDMKGNNTEVPFIDGITIVGPNAI